MAARNPSLKAFLLALVVLGAGCGQKSEPYDPLKFMVWGGQSDYNNPLSILFHDLPGGRPIDSFDRLVALKLLDHRLTLPDERLPWPSEFFPTWFGGVSGRWQDPKVLLLLRSLTGFDPPSPADAHALVDAVDRGDQAAAARLYRLAPTEKYDLAVGDYDFHVSRAESLIRGHNRPEMLLATPFWMGYCNGAALAALRFREPVREVDVVSSDGHAIRFHPNDVKALLALSHTQAEFAHWQIGRRCDRYTTSTPECNDVNPATLVIALTNRIGLRKSGFVIDTNPLAPVINMAVRSTFVSVLRPPYRVLAPDPIKYVVDVAIGIEGASTLISSSAADRPDPSRGEGYFRPVTRGVKYLEYLAQLALDKDRRLVGGRWTGPRMSGPDFAFGALYDEFEDVQIDDHIHANRLIRFSLVQKIYEQSILTAGPDGKRPGRGTVRVSSVLSDDQDDLLVAEDSGAAARISRGRLLHLYGRLGARSAARADRLNCDVGAAKPARAGDPHAFSLPLDEARRPGSRFLVIDATTEIEDRKGTHVRCALLERDGATVARFERVIRPYVF